MKISFIGYGNLAKAIVNTLVKDSTYSVSVAAPSLTPDLSNKIKTYSDNKAAIKGADIIILAVKPFQMSAVLQEIKSHIPNTALLISVAAGLTLSWFSSLCKSDQAIIRAMPNTPASVGCAATPLFANSFATELQKEQATEIFSKIGFCSWVSREEDIETLTALSGSGPAYVFSFIEALVNAGVTLGLDKKTAHDYVLKTLEGALKLAKNTSLSIEELRTQVTSTGGTTAAALEILHTPLQQLIFLALDAAKKRALELNKLL